MPKSPQTVSRFDCLGFLYEVLTKGLQVCELEMRHWKGDFMCSSCGSSNQAEFPTEMLVHFGGLKNLDKPGVWLFPELLVCLECGFAQTTIPTYELAQLAAGAVTSESLVRNASVSGNTLSELHSE